MVVVGAYGLHCRRSRPKPLVRDTNRWYPDSATGRVHTEMLYADPEWDGDAEMQTLTGTCHVATGEQVAGVRQDDPYSVCTSTHRCRSQ